MNRDQLWQKLVGHATTGWCSPEEVELPAVPATSRLVWCGIGGSLLPSETLVRALGGPESQQLWTPLASLSPWLLI